MHCLPPLLRRPGLHRDSSNPWIYAREEKMQRRDKCWGRSWHISQEARLRRKCDPILTEPGPANEPSKPPVVTG